MTEVLILGDTPSGVQAAILLAKKGLNPSIIRGGKELPRRDITSFYGVKNRPGNIFENIAENQAQQEGATFESSEIKSVEKSGNVWEIETGEGQKYAPYIVIASEEYKEISESLELETTEEELISVDSDGRTSEEKIYAGGSSTRKRNHLAISVGDGASIAADILEQETGKTLDEAS